MRIISGSYGGRKLLAPKNSDIRPTSDKIRGAVFNILRGMDVLEGAYALDLFCGTGALGLEALSNGAAQCVFIDKNRTSLDLARENAENLGTVHCQFLLKDAAKLPVRPESTAPAALVFLDPPYHQNLIRPALDNLHAGGWLAETAALVLEMDRSDNCALPEAYNLLQERTYGDTKILLADYTAVK